MLFKALAFDIRKGAKSIWNKYLRILNVTYIIRPTLQALSALSTDKRLCGINRYSFLAQLPSFSSTVGLFYL